MDMETRTLTLREAADLVAGHIQWVDGPQGMQPKTPRDAVLYDIVRQLIAMASPTEETS